MDNLENSYKEEIGQLIDNVPIIYKYIDMKGGCELLNNTSVLFRNPSFFNDPYDCFTSLIGFENMSDQYISDLINKYYSNLNRIKRRELERDFNNRARSGMQELFEKEFIVKEKARKGIVCFTQDFKNLLMWSQYADSHKGICIGFNLKKLYLDLRTKPLDDIALIKVKYTPELEKINYFKDKRGSILNWFRVKSIDWAYEKEIRILCSSNHFTNNQTLIIQFDKSLIEEVFLGSNFDRENEDLLIKMIKENYKAAKIYKMELSKTRFELIHSEIN